MNGAKRFSRNFQIKVYSYSTEWFPFKYRVNLVAARTNKEAVTMLNRLNRWSVATKILSKRNVRMLTT